MVFNGKIWDGIYAMFFKAPVSGEGFRSTKWITSSIEKMKNIEEEVIINAPLPPVSNYRECLLLVISAMVSLTKGKVRILDYGGSIGYAYYQSLYCIHQSDQIEYHSVELDILCNEGNLFFTTKKFRLFFHSSQSDIQGPFDIIHLGSVLQYIDDDRSLLTKLCGLKPTYLLFVDAYVGNIPSFASISHYYDSMIPCWFFNIHELLAIVFAFGYKLVYESVFKPTIPNKEQVYLWKI